ncbi:hypothetical protein CHS0354_024001 [Potamilus streckersoni]|uniref:Aldehyde dehydrogenase n=1 Tax=Potamilus streckersoni TaxID=2493646 RepID=A0AAE0RZM7_9BIVA|nr:hypothetical protein CHS0354_024001 [Potamilus streckersoni]
MIEKNVPSGIKYAVRSQHDFFATHLTKSIQFRKSQLTKLSQILKNNEQKLYDAISLDFNKSTFETHLTELLPIYRELKLAISNVKRWSSEKHVTTGLENFPAKSFIKPEPLGVTLVISAWNYPYNISLIPAISSLAAGNTVILKPSEIASHASSVLSEIINENFDPNYFHVIEGGSTKVGKIVYEAAAKHLTPVTLELGGKSPSIVTEHADIAISAKRLVWAKFLNAGQTCIAPDYVLIHSSVKSQFLSSLVNEIEMAKYSFDNNNYVQIVNETHFNRLLRLLQETTIFYGGLSNKSTRFIQPTILTHVELSHPVMQEEIFGPILPVLEYSDLNQAIQYVNSQHKPLSCYVYSTNKSQVNKILEEISFGGGAVNDSLMHIANHNLPFGGVGHSGLGAYHGEHGFKTFSHYKSILWKKNGFEPTLKYSPYSETKLKWIKRFV